MMFWADGQEGMVGMDTKLSKIIYSKIYYAGGLAMKKKLLSLFILVVLFGTMVCYAEKAAFVHGKIN